jgi:HK97 family phage portal protein
MGAICKTIEQVVTKRSGTSGTYHPAKWLIDFFNGGEDSATGLRINKNSALKYTPFWSAVRIISGTIGALPFLVYKRINDEDKEREPKHPIYKMLHDRPNDYMDSLTFLETRMAHVLTYGNGYAEIQRDGGGRPIHLWPLLPNRTKRVIDKDTEIPYYEIILPDNTKTTLPDYNVLHIKGLGFDGLTGYDVVSYHKQAIAYGMAVKEYGARFFGNNASPGGALEVPEELSDEAHKRLKESWRESHQGLTEAHHIAILEDGTKFNKIGIDPEQAQAIEVQKWTVDDCSRIFQIPPHMLASMEYSKYNNVEQLEIEFVKRTMLYWFRKLELECNYKLFMPSEYGKYFSEILYDGLLRGDIKTRYECYRIGKMSGFLSTDDILRKENMNSIGPAGDIYLEPLNMVPAGSQRNDGLLKSYEVRAAHKSLILSQWLRIIKNLNGSSQWNKERASNILCEPVTVYASILSRQDKARGILNNLLDEIMNEETKLTIYDADRLADLTMARIGGENAAT